MIRGLITFVALVALFLFGYFYFSDRSGRSSADKAASAGAQVLTTAKQTGVEMLIEGRLKADLGLDAAAYLHVYFRDGTAIVYGVAPESATAEKIAAAARAVPGVTSVEVLVQPRPATMTPMWSKGGEPAAPPTP